MKLRLSDAEILQLKAFVEKSPDCEQLSAREVVMDLYDIEKPVSLDFVYVKGGIGIDGAAELLYSEADDGYYMGERIEDAAAVRNALTEAGVFSENTDEK